MSVLILLAVSMVSGQVDVVDFNSIQLVENLFSQFDQLSVSEPSAEPSAEPTVNPTQGIIIQNPHLTAVDAANHTSFMFNLNFRQLFLLGWFLLNKPVCGANC